MEKEILELLPSCIKEIINKEDFSNIQELRFRVNSPIFILKKGKGKFLQEEFIIGRDLLDMIFKRFCDYSPFSFEEEIREGFITLKGGHRVGICGHAITEKGVIKNIKDINSINIRFSREIKNCSDDIFFKIKKMGLSNYLIASEPCGGKTTVLRDLIRRISEGELGEYFSISVIDEKGELCALSKGVSKNNIGYCCDVFDMYPKKEGIIKALRFFSPKLIVLDEIATLEESEEIIKGMNGGVPFISTVHAKNMDELRKRPQIKLLIDSGCIDGIFFLSGRENPGSLKSFYGRDDIYD
ncbi:MAG: stage III sporulation protein AA [Clostridia bacterium]|nr:stage III sporulation protein AA [Clostridia bacterium]